MSCFFINYSFGGIFHQSTQTLSQDKGFYLVLVQKKRIFLNTRSAKTSQPNNFMNELEKITTKIFVF